MVGMEEWLYQDLESGAFHRSFTPELADKLATLYGIPVEDILDNYTLFLHRAAEPSSADTGRISDFSGWFCGAIRFFLALIAFFLFSLDDAPPME